MSVGTKSPILTVSLVNYPTNSLDLPLDLSVVCTDELQIHTLSILGTNGVAYETTTGIETLTLPTYSALPTCNVYASDMTYSELIYDVSNT